MPEIIEAKYREIEALEQKAIEEERKRKEATDRVVELEVQLKEAEESQPTEVPTEGSNCEAMTGVGRRTMGLLDKSISRIQIASEMSIQHYGKPLLLTYSGGKDSDAILEVAKIAGIPYEVANNHTTADAPETVYHIRKKFKELELQGIVCKIVKPTYNGKRATMWNLIPQKKLPPTRLMRYCCAVLKERTGANRAIATGVRWAESNARATRGIYETINKKAEHRIILNNDNDDRRKVIERCQMQGRTVTNPIIDWQDRDVNVMIVSTF